MKAKAMKAKARTVAGVAGAKKQELVPIRKSKKA